MLIPISWVHVLATRDLQSHGVVSDEEFNNLFEASEKMWPNANFFILPIIRRKDMSNEIIDAANEIIISECEKGMILLENVTSSSC
jgi:hypothetical protein